MFLKHKHKPRSPEDEPQLQGLPDAPDDDEDPEATNPRFRMPEIMFNDWNENEPDEID